MPFLNEEDYSIVTEQDDLVAYTESSPEKRIQAEKMAIEFLKGSLRSRYDIDAIFSAVGDDRNPVIVMYCVELVIYTLMKGMSGRGISEIRQIAYDQMVADLKEVSIGRKVYDLPVLTDSDGKETGGKIRWGGQPKTSNNENW